MASIFDRISAGANRLSHAWNAFINTPDSSKHRAGSGSSISVGGNPSRNRLTVSMDRSILASIYTRMAIDTAAINLNHVYQDDAGRLLRYAKTGLNNCLTLRANIDQGARQFKQDIVMTLFDKGVIAIVPVDTSDVPFRSGSYDILTMRVGEIVNWYPRYVRIRLWNDVLGRKEELTLPKSMVAIVENPLYSVMNEPNSTYQRLIRKLNLLDSVDEAAGSGKLDIIIQLPYVVKNETRQAQAEERARDIEAQLKGSKYGVAYIDGTERVTQLNRPAENNMLSQIEFLTSLLYSQLGLSPSVFDGTADEKTLLSYYNRTIEPILAAISEAMTSTFLTKTARTQGQAIEYRRDPFKLLTINDLAGLADKLTRNEILTSNEFRSLIGFKPSDDPQADKLLNKNLPMQSQAAVSAMANLGEISATQDQSAIKVYPQKPQLALPSKSAPAPQPAETNQPTPPLPKRGE